MPSSPIEVLVLDALQDDAEQLPSIMRMLGEWRDRVDDGFVQADVLDALRRLLTDGSVVALEEAIDMSELMLCAHTTLLDSDLATYWYKPTPAGQAKWDSWQRAVDY